MSFVQSVVANGVSTTSFTSPGITTTAGNFLAMGSSTGNTNITSVLDSKSNSWTASGQNPKTTASLWKSHVFWSKNVLGGASHTFTWNLSGTDWPSGEVHEYAGRDITSPITAESGSAEVSASTSHTGPSVTAALGDDVAAFFAADAAGTCNFTAGAGFTIPANSSYTAGATSVVSCAEYQANVAAGSVTAGLTTSVTAQAAGIILAIKLAAVVRQNMMLMGVG